MFFRKAMLFSCLLSSILSGGIYESGLKDYKVDENQKHALELAKSLPNSGTIRAKSNGYVYLDISNEYITKIFPILILDGHLRPTDSFSSVEGAHITVIKDHEANQDLSAIVGREIAFTVKELRTVDSYRTQDKHGNPVPSSLTGTRWVIAVESSELEELRMSLGLSPLVDRHDFHITLGFEIPFSRINNFGERP